MISGGELGVAIVLARAGDPMSIPTLRLLVGHDDVRIRLLAQLGLARAGDDDADSVDAGLAQEPELANYFVLAARAGTLAIGSTALDYLAAQAAYERTPAALRASCTWAIGQHDLDRARSLLAQLDPDGTAHLIAIVRARGGALSATHGALASPHADRVASLLTIAGAPLRTRT